MEAPIAGLGRINTTVNLPEKPKPANKDQVHPVCLLVPHSKLFPNASQVGSFLHIAKSIEELGATFRLVHSEENKEENEESTDATLVNNDSDEPRKRRKYGRVKSASNKSRPN
jgi:hypothetical protein